MLTKANIPERDTMQMQISASRPAFACVGGASVEMVRHVPEMQKRVSMLRRPAFACVGNSNVSENRHKVKGDGGLLADLVPFIFIPVV